MDGWMDGWTDGWMDGWMDVCYIIYAIYIDMCVHIYHNGGNVRQHTANKIPKGKPTITVIVKNIHKIKSRGESP